MANELTGDKPAAPINFCIRSMNNPPIFLGLDFGTESVRALLVDGRGRELASSVCGYEHGQITRALPGSSRRLPPHYALQHPLDWIESSASAVKEALKKARCSKERILGIGVDFTSCTMLPVTSDGTPLCLLPKFRNEPLAWPKLWKHHGAEEQARRLTAIARERGEGWLSRYGGTIGLEWFFPKMLETLECAPKVFERAEIWLEAGDWFVWQLVGGLASDLPRSTCQAGYKALWDRRDGFPNREYFSAVHPDLAEAVETKLPGRFLAPGERAGGLSPDMAAKFGLKPDVAVSAAIIDAHAGVPGAGAAEAGTLVMVLGTSSCHMLNAVEARPVPGVAGIVQDGIVPGFVGYETGQAAVGDAFDWVRRLCGEADFERLTEMASEVPVGAEGVLCRDWLNGCRTPLMDGSLTGAFTGLTLRHGPAHIYRAALEASGFGLKWIVELLREHGVAANRFVATGGLAHQNPLLMQIYADILGAPISIPASRQGPALGAAILGALAAGERLTGFSSIGQVIRAMASGRKTTRMVRPKLSNGKIYDQVYMRYRALASAA